MGDRSHVARRSARAVERDFPAYPTLSATRGCAGLAFILGDEASIPDLRPLRREVREIRRGPLTPNGDGDVLLVVFDRSVPVDAADWPNALPLVSVAPATLRSFADRLDGDGSQSTAGRFRRLELRWGGQVHTIPIDALKPIPLTFLWALPPVILHPQAPHVVRPRVGAFVEGDDGDQPASGDAAAGGEAESGDGEAAGAKRAIPVAGLKIPAGDRDFIAEMNAALGGSRGSMADLFRDLRARLAGRGSVAPGEGTAPPRRNPLAGMAAWLRWNTPLGDGLRQQFSNRMKLVDRLIASGDIDAALRHALRLGSGQAGGRNPLAGSLAPPRGKLDFDISGGSYAAPIFDDHGFDDARQRYRQLAEQLEQQGDFRRAAYILAQLLGEHEAAVLMLERGELYADAAQLALRARLSPVVAIRMLYLAGERDTALALARRTGCFDALAHDSRERDSEYHAYVIKAWTEMLASTGQWLRALQVTDALAAEGLGESLLDARREWLAAAFDHAGDRPVADLVARALLTPVERETGGDAERFAAFPLIAVNDGASPFDAALSHVQAASRDEGDAARVLLDLLDALMRLADPVGDEQAWFWKHAAPALIDGLARSIIAVASGEMRGTDLDAIQKLLRDSDQRVLAGDLEKLRKLVVRNPRASDRFDLPLPGASYAAVRIGCVLASGHILAWRDGDLLELRDRHGGLGWQMRMTSVVALIPIGSSADALVVQSRADEFFDLSRIVTPTRTLHPIGAIPLTAAHDVTSETQWLVQIDEQVGALDLVKLCAPQPEIEFLWACQLGLGVRVLAFCHQLDGPRWITLNVTEGERGTMEKWRLANAGELTSQICLPSNHEGDRQVRDWYWAPGTDSLSTVDLPHRWMATEAWSEAAAAKAWTLAQARRQLAINGVERIQPCDLARGYVRHTLSTRLDTFETCVTVPEVHNVAMSVDHPAELPLRCVARHAPPAGQIKARKSADKGKRRALPGAGAGALLADDHGRMILVDAVNRRVTLIP